MSINITNPGVAGITVESDPTALKLTGGSLSGELQLPQIGNLLNTNIVVDSYNDTGAGTHYYHTFTPFDGKFNLAPNGGGITFPNGTVQTTAGLPLTGGTLSGKLVTTATATTAPLNIAVSITPPTTTVAGDVWVGTGNIIFKDSAGFQRACLTNNTANAIDCSTSGAPAFRITQRGTSDALIVEDDTNPDSTPFVINANGRVFIGTTTQTGSAKLTVIGNVAVTGQVEISQAHGLYLNGVDIKAYTRKQGDIQHLSRILAGSVISWSYNSGLNLSTFNLSGEIPITLANEHYGLIKVLANSGPASVGLAVQSYSGGQMTFSGDVSDGANNPYVWFEVDDYGFFTTFSL